MNFTISDIQNHAKYNDFIIYMKNKLLSNYAQIRFFLKNIFECRNMAKQENMRLQNRVFVMSLMDTRRSFKMHLRFTALDQMFLSASHCVQFYMRGQKQKSNILLYLILHDWVA